jgi:hypothetical protein
MVLGSNGYGVRQRVTVMVSESDDYGVREERLCYSTDGEDLDVQNEVRHGGDTEFRRAFHAIPVCAYSCGLIVVLVLVLALVLV